MRQTELVEELALRSGLSKRDCAAVLGCFKKVVQEALKNGEPVVLNSFGVFLKVRLKKKPLFGQKQQAGHWTKVRFKPSRRL